MALPLLAGETAVVQRFGHARVLSLLGAQERYYPHPWWFRPGRPPVVDDAEFRAATMLSKAPAYNLPFLRVVHIGDRLELIITAGDATSYIGGADEELEAFEEALREAADVCAFLPGLADVPQTYVWAPGQQGPAAIVAPGGERSTRIGCNFLLLVRGNVEPTARQVEDGFAVLLTGAMYARLRQAVEAGRPIEIGLPAGAVSTLALRLEPRPGPATRPVQAVRPGPGTHSESVPQPGPAGGDGDLAGNGARSAFADPAITAARFRSDAALGGESGSESGGESDSGSDSGSDSVSGSRSGSGTGSGTGSGAGGLSGSGVGGGAALGGHGVSGEAHRVSGAERPAAARRSEDSDQAGDEHRFRDAPQHPDTPPHDPDRPLNANQPLDANRQPNAGRSLNASRSLDGDRHLDRDRPLDGGRSEGTGRPGDAVNHSGTGTLRDSGHTVARSAQSGVAPVQPAGERYRTGELTIYHPPRAEDAERSGRDADGRALRHVDRGRIVLLTSEEQLRRATTAAELGDFIDRARGIVDRAFTGVRHGTEELMVEFHLGPSRPVAVRIMARPEAPPRELQVVLERQLLALRPPTIRYTEVAFQLHLQLYR